MRCFPRPGGLCDQDDIDQEARIARWIAERDWNSAFGVPLDRFTAIVVRRRLITLIDRVARHPICSPVDEMTLEDGGAVDAPPWLADTESDPADVVCEADAFRRRVDAVPIPVSAQQRQVWRLICAGYSQAEIVEQLGLTARQVDNACYYLYQKARAAWQRSPS